MAGGSMAGGSTTQAMSVGEQALSLQDAQCFDNPDQEACEQTVYSDDNIRKDIDELCVGEGTSMPWMIGCTYNRLCKVIPGGKWIVYSSTIVMY